MFFMTISVFCFTLLQILVEIQSASEQSDVDGYDVAGTEWAIRNTVNNLFSTLKLKDMDQKLKLKQHSTIHNFFTSMTLRDHDNLKEISRLTKVDSVDNSTQVFITQLNEVLNKDYKSDEKTDAVYVTNFIEEFLENLNNLKEIYGLKNNDTNCDINKDNKKHSDNSECENATPLENENQVQENILSDNEYWQPSARRIYEGQTVKIDRYPFMASVKFFNKFQCGGSIIKSDLVITSASCLQLAWNNRFFRENPAFLSVQVGSSHYQGGGGEDIPVLEIYFHPNYNPKNLRHNLAIMRLLRALKFGAKFPEIKKIEFDRNPWPLPVNTDGIVIVGWGAKSSSNIINNPIKNKLSYALLDYYPLAECQEIYSKEYVTNTNFCAGFFSKGSGACNHDAGGPGISHGILVGVVSFGSPICGAPDAPTVFTKVGFYAEWIEKIMNQKVLQQYQTTTKQNKHTVPHIFETTTFKIKPFDSDDLTVPERIPIKEVDTLRMKDKASFFEELIATVFDSNEIKEFVDEVKAEKQKMKTKLEKKVKDQLLSVKKKKHNTKTISSTTIKLKSKSKSKSKTKKKIHKHVAASDTSSKINTTKLQYGFSSITSTKRVTAASGHRNITKQNQSTYYEKKLGEALESLIDNLDLDEISEFEYSSSEILESEKPKDKRKYHLKSNKQLPKRLKSNSVDKLYNSLLERARNQVNKDNHNSNENENIRSTDTEESENTQEDEDDDDSKETESYVSQSDEKGESSEDSNTNENGDDENDDSKNEEEDETVSYETDYNEDFDDNDSAETDDSTQDLHLLSKEDQSKRNNNHERGHKNKGKNVSQQSNEDDLETSGIQKTKFKKSQSNSNDTEMLLRILAQSDDFYELVAKAVQEKMH